MALLLTAVNNKVSTAYTYSKYRFIQSINKIGDLYKSIPSFQLQSFLSVLQSLLQQLQHITILICYSTMHTLKISRVASKLMTQAVVYNFNINGWAPLDPRKHITMNHNVHDIYLDLWEYGHYPEQVHISSIPARTYEPQIINIIVSTINARYGSNITPEFLLSKSQREWNRFLSKDLKVSQSFHDLYPALLGRLSTDIFIRESRLTWVVQQKFRQEYTLASFDANPSENVEDFIKRYNQNIESLVLISNYGFAAQIDQAESALEKHEQQQNVVSPGLLQLKNLPKEHDNLINRLLAYFH